MRALVTGGAGFLGSFLCERLVEKGVSVTCMDNFTTGSLDNIEHLIGDPGFTVIESDLVKVTHISGKVDLVLHFASMASPADYLAYPIETLKVGSVGTLNALNIARENSARFILASTSEVYGDPLVHPQPEAYWGNVNPVGPRSVYDEAKRFSESLTIAYRNTHGLSTGIVRIFNTYGPRMRPNDGRAIPTFIRQALLGEPITIAGDGSQTRSFCYVNDTINGILALAESDFGGPINIGNPYELAVVELAHEIKKLTGSSSPFTFIERAVDDPKVRCPNISLATTQLSWRPKVGLLDGLRDTIDWFARQLQVSTTPK